MCYRAWLDDWFTSCTCRVYQCVTGHGWMTGLLAVLVECINVLQGMVG